MSLLFETAFRPEETPEGVFDLAVELRDLEETEYIRSTFFGTVANLSLIDDKINEFSKGWTSDRISPVSRAILRLAIYEILFCEDVPDHVAVNEAIELVKIYDDEEKVRKFVNGILNAVMKAKAPEANG